MGEMKLEDVKVELDRTRDELERSQLQWYQLLIDLEQSQSELFQTQRELEESELFGKQMQVEMEQVKNDFKYTQEELGQTKSLLMRRQDELDRYRYREAIASQTNSENERKHKYLVWDAWYAYRNGDINQMVDCLQKSLKYTSLSLTKTVSNWVKSWSEFSQQKGEIFEVRNLNSYQEWKQLLRRMIVKNTLPRAE